MDAAQVLTLPCSRDRHTRCAGHVALGIARHRAEHECLCSCHNGAAAIRKF